MPLPRECFIIILALLLSGCDKNAAPEESAPSAPPPTTIDPTAANFLGLTAPKPVIWIEHPPSSSMRAANYTVPGRDGNEAAQIVVFYFGPTEGGTIEDNISRWRGQFQVTDSGDLPEAKIERFEADSMPVTLVELNGEWREMGTVSFTPDQVFLMAIVEAPVGKIFIRFTGPTATIEANREAFLEMIRGLRKTPT